MNINICKRWLLVLCMVDFGGILQFLNRFPDLQRPIYVWFNECGRIIDKQGC
jgi:hypothetical protein